MITRRALLQAWLASALTCEALLVSAQTRRRRIGFLWERNEDSEWSARIDAFKTGMRELGYTEGRDYVIEQRFAKTELSRLPALAAELVALKVDAIVTSSTPSTLAASKATRDIPILITTVGDPIGIGLAASLRRPGGNVTGLAQNVGSELYTKRLDLLRQVVPGMRRVAFLYDPDNGNDVLALKQFESDCGKLGLSPVHGAVRKAEDIPVAFGTLVRENVQGLVVSGTSTNTASQKTIIEHAAKHRVPAAYSSRAYAESGGLISYGANYPDLYRRAAGYADKIFKGSKPGDLPIELPTKFELVVNLKTAKALGITIPQSILIRADRVIE